MKKFFLIIYSYDITSQIDNILSDVKSIVNTNKVNHIFPSEGGSVIIHFESNVNISELKDLTYLTICQYSNFFLLTELTENDMLGMPKEDLEQILSLDGEELEFDENYTIEEVEQFLDDITIDGQIDEELLCHKLISNVKSNCKIPTLNDLLDKILEQGQDSLTNNEKQLLNNYSNN